MKLKDLKKLLNEWGSEYDDFETVVPIGLLCATVKQVEVVKFNPKTGLTIAIGSPMKTKHLLESQIAIYISPSEEPRR